MSILTLHDIGTAPLDFHDLGAQYTRLHSSLERATTYDEFEKLLRTWELMRRTFYTWKSSIEIRFRQRTTGESERAGAARLAELLPSVQRYDAEIKRRVIASPYCRQLEDIFGAHIIERWRRESRLADTLVEGDLVTEKRLSDEYMRLIGSASVEFNGERRTLSGVAAFTHDHDRATRKAASEASWSFFAANAQELDRIFDELVACRNAMARAAGYSSFAEIAYQRQGRTDYSLADVSRFREEIRTTIVPLVTSICARQTHALGIDTLMLWDEPVFDLGPALNVPPDAAALLSACRTALTATHPTLGDFVGRMLEARTLDIESRAGKAGGACCTFVPHLDMPYVLANTNGTTHDAQSLVHEIGHAFQNYCCRTLPILEHIIPTDDVGEIHSHALEFLIWPHCAYFFGDDAERYRRKHLRFLIRMLPYIAAVDHFQELVYANPTANAAERHTMWSEMERSYLPWRRHGDLPHVKRGGAWQRQHHIYSSPFYYIDYGLALCVALQLWAQSLERHEEAVEKYLALCALGGRSPFGRAVRSTGLRSPFDSGALEELAETLSRRALLG